MNTIISHEGAFAYRSEENDSREPISRVWIWPLVEARTEGMGGANLADAIGKPATCNGGHVSCYLGHGIYFRARMPQLGSTPALSITETPVVRPKVRAGVETRYHNGTWQKYLKRDGWVAAG